MYINTHILLFTTPGYNNMT